jgi:hypothetical protein
MSRITRKECWNLLEDKLLTISEARIGKTIPESKLAVAVLISAGRDKDVEFIESQAFRDYCSVAALHYRPTKELMMRTLSYLEHGGAANFSDESREIQ